MNPTIWKKFITAFSEEETENGSRNSLASSMEGVFVENLNEDNKEYEFEFQSRAMGETEILSAVETPETPIAPVPFEVTRCLMDVRPVQINPE